jgi:hypothetical protein
MGSFGAKERIDMIMESKPFKPDIFVGMVHKPI